MNEEIIKLLPVYAIQYWYLLFVFAILTFILSLFRLKKNSFVISNVNHLGSIGKVVSFAILIIFLGMAARGFGKSSLNSSDIERIMPIEYGVLATNAPFMIMETFFKVNTVSSFPGSDIHTQFNPEKKYSSNKPFENQNVVIIILESFAKEYIGSLNNNKGSTPFLDSLISQGLICRNAYANGRTSLEALPAVLCSMPSLGERPIALSLDNHKQLNSIAEILSHEGYYTSFFYGARNGNLGINNFAREAGFQDYFGRNEYGLNAAVSPWGIFDEDFLLFAKTKMDSFREPFITCIITLSSHSPFVLPEKFQNKFRDQPTPQLRSIAYTDYCLKQFFKKASSGKWYNNTLFVLVADHTSYSYSVKYNSRIGMFAIPILYFHPNDHKLKGFYDNVTQQCDIKPSILQYLHYQKKFISFGSSIFSEKDEHYAVMRLLNQYQFIDNFNLIDINMKGELMRAYKYKEDELLINDLSNSVTNNIDNELLKFKAIINKTLN